VISTASLNDRLELLHTLLRSLQPGLIAVSGGVDSRFLIHVAWLWKLDFHAAYAVGPHQSERERRAVLGWLKAQVGFVHMLGFNPLTLPEVRGNAASRCYHCKHALFSHLARLAEAKSLVAVLDGTQADDMRVHRPGRQALQALGVHSPLRQVNMGKAQIRQAAQRLGLAEPGQPSRPCLLTRFPYDYPVSRQQLALVGRVEDNLSALGLQRYRFRLLKGRAFLLQIHEQERNEWQKVKKQALDLISGYGLAPVDVELTGHLSGFFDKERPNGQ